MTIQQVVSRKRRTAVDRAIEALGGLPKLAKACGVTYQAVQKWQRTRRVPAERVLTVERVSGVSRGELRPDLYPEDEVRTGTS
jgi:DNA-binding transcriptional regulator YdaS (Cro superfamily)